MTLVVVYFCSIWSNYCYIFCKLATEFMHLKSQDFEVDPDLLNNNSVDSDQLAGMEDRAVWVPW